MRSPGPAPRLSAAGDAVARGCRVLWVAPTSLLGLAAALLTLLSGGRVAKRRGLLEVWGGFAGACLRSKLVGARAMTLGHVVLGTDRAALEQTRAHELAHVRQAERWGPLFLPAYAAASGWAWLSGRHYYLDNWFERDARRQEVLPVRGEGSRWGRADAGRAAGRATAGRAAGRAAGKGRRARDGPSGASWDSAAGLGKGEPL
jgi:hypothetical protein